MKQIIVSFFLIAIVASGFGQKHKKTVPALPVLSENKDAEFSICLNYPMTTHLVFNNPIEYFDIGASAEEVEISITKENNKVLKIILKSNKTPSFTKTNLTVRTAGKYYSYLCRYKKECGIPFIYMKDTPISTISDTTIIDNKKLGVNNELNTHTNVEEKKIPSYDSICAILKKKHSYLEKFEYNDEVGKVEMLVSKCYVKNDKLYFVVKIVNKSSIGYDINSFNFSIATRKKNKGKAIQINQVAPVYVNNNNMYVKGFGYQLEKIFVLDKFTFNEKNKELFLESWEKNGDRNLKCSIPQEVVLNAIPF